MVDLFLDPKVLDYSGDRYQLILLALRWAKQLKAKGDPAPMQELIERALKDLVEQRVSREEILSVKAAVEAPAPPPEALVAAAEEKVSPAVKAGPNGAAKKIKTKKKK